MSTAPRFQHLDRVWVENNDTIYRVERSAPVLNDCGYHYQYYLTEYKHGTEFGPYIEDELLDADQYIEAKSAEIRAAADDRIVSLEQEFGRYRITPHKDADE